MLQNAKGHAVMNFAVDLRKFIPFKITRSVNSLYSSTPCFRTEVFPCALRIGIFLEDNPKMKRLLTAR